MKLFDIFRKKKVAGIPEEPKESPGKPEVQPPEMAKANLPLCNLCNCEIHDKPIIFKYNNMKHPFHKKCMRQIRRHPERYGV